jgi:hypothetical protein
MECGGQIDVTWFVRRHFTRSGATLDPPAAARRVRYRGTVAPRADMADCEGAEASG